MRIDIGLEIENSHTSIVGLENDILVIALNLPQNAPHINKTLNPYAIYNTLENKGKNTYNNTKIIEKIETPDFIEYRFNYGLILNIFVDKENKVILEHTKKEMAFINPIYFSYDIIGDSNAIPQDELSELTKDYGYERKAYKSIFKKEVCINYGCLEGVIFSHCEFEDKLSLYRLKGSNEAIEFHNGMNFENCIFNGEVEFRNLVSGTPLPNHKYHNNERETNFKNCIFKKRVDFSNAKFCNDVYFNNSQFYDSADFHECEFEKTACFYGATFYNEAIPNFSQAIFKENLNFVNVKCNFEFKDLKALIENDDKTFSSKVANDFRDSFRIIKNALVKDNNLLDASNFHKYELYCKEIELEQIWHKQGKTAETEADIKRNTHKFRDYIDCLLLGFYRKLCEHHTDFLKVFNNLILLIVLYALFFKGIAYLHNAKIENISEEFILSKISNNFEFYFNLGLIIFIVLGSILILCKIYKNFFIYFIRFCFKKLKLYKIWCNIRQLFKRFKTFLKILIKDLWYLIESLILAFFFAYAFYVLLVGFGGKIIDLNKDYGYSLFINTLFVGLYISLVYTKSLIIGRYILLIASYMGFFIVLIKYPSIIHPLIGKIADTDKTCTCPSVVALGILYTILIFLVVFSLQKTARKNSIIPH